MPANSRWDLIRRLKGKQPVFESSTESPCYETVSYSEHTTVCLQRRSLTASKSYNCLFFFSLSSYRMPCLINPLNVELNPICHLLALLGAHHILHVISIRVKRVEKTESNKYFGSNCFSFASNRVFFIR